MKLTALFGSMLVCCYVGWTAGAPAGKKCGSAAGTNCPDTMCVDAKYAKGECKKEKGMWKWKSGLMPVEPKPPADSADKNCGTKAGTNCPPQMCVPKSYGGKGSCKEVSPGKWRWNSGPLPA